MKENERKNKLQTFSSDNNPLSVPNETKYGFNRNRNAPGSGLNWNLYLSQHLLVPGSKSQPPFLPHVARVLDRHLVH